MKGVVVFLLCLCFLSLPPAWAGEDPLAAWTPDFDPSGAKYTYLLSCVGHPAIEGVSAGFRIRDRVWKESGGKLYVDFRPLSQLGGEKDVINKLKIGAIQGMMSSSVAAAYIVPRLGIVNLPFVVDSFARLTLFREDEKLWGPFRDAALKKGLLVADFTGYGSYGWATTRPVENFAQAGEINFRIAQAPVNIDTYKALGLKFTVLPWPDVPQALQTGVIDGLDHSAIVCNLSRKFTVARYYTALNYAQGLYIHIINQRWLKKLPDDLKKILLAAIREESAVSRKQLEEQQKLQIADARKNGVSFFSLPAADIEKMKQLLAPVYEKWGDKIGKDYLDMVRKTLNNYPAWP